MAGIERETLWRALGRLTVGIAVAVYASPFIAAFGFVVYCA